MTTLDNPNSNLPAQSTVSVRPTALRYGLIIGLALIALSIVFNMMDMLDYTGQKSNMLANVANWAVMIGGLVMAIKHHRDNELGGYITFGRCVGLGALIGVIAGLLAGIFTAIYLNFIDTGILDKTFAAMSEQFAEQGLDENAAEMAMSWTKTMFKPLPLTLISVVVTCFTMTIISLIVGAIMKKNPPSTF